MDSDGDTDVMPRQRLTRAQARRRTRERLLAAAAPVFAGKGFAGASVEEIAESAGFSIGALYANFASKEELFLELLSGCRGDLIAQAAQAVRAGGSGSGQAAADLSRLLTEAVRTGPSFALLHSEFWMYAMRNPRVLQAIGDRADSPRRSLEALVGRERHQRGAPPEASAPAVAAVVAAMFGGLARQRLLNPSTVPDDLFGLALKWLFTGITASGTGPGAAGLPSGED
jgi:AcrR family transcriptional regulator